MWVELMVDQGVITLPPLKCPWTLSDRKFVWRGHWFVTANFQEFCQSLCMASQKTELEFPYTDFNNAYKYSITDISKNTLWVNLKISYSSIIYRPECSLSFSLTDPIFKDILPLVKCYYYTFYNQINFN